MWLRGDTEGPAAHVHEGVRLADGSGWAAVGGSLPAENQNTRNFRAVIRVVDNEARTKWTQTLGDEHQDTDNSSYSEGFSIIEVRVRVLERQS